MSGVADDVMNIPSPFRETAKVVNSSIEASYNATFDKSTYTEFKPTQDDFRFYEVDPKALETIKNAEVTNNGGFVSKAMDVIKEAPTTILDKGMNAATDAIVTKGLTAAGLQTTPNYTNVTNTTITPKFDSAPISNIYDANGIGYGAIPDNRIQFLASQQMQIGDFGLSSFNNFSRLGTV
jgi:hypothetical protein